MSATAPLRVLVVEDSMITVKKLATMVEELGHTVVAVAKTGEEAVAACRDHSPDLVTMDITLPGMDGVTATRLITEQFPAAVVIMVTAHGQESMIIDALKAGAQGYVLKPILPGKLGAMIDKATRAEKRQA